MLPDVTVKYDGKKNLTLLNERASVLIYFIIQMSLRNFLQTIL
jgi:hypothetical protein